MDDMHRNVQDLHREMQDIRDSLEESQSLQSLIDEIDAEYFHVCSYHVHTPINCHLAKLHLQNDAILNSIEALMEQNGYKSMPILVGCFFFKTNKWVFFSD